MLITSLLNLSVSAQQINSLYILWQLDFNGSISTKIQNKNTLRKSNVSNCESHGLAVSMWAHMWDSLVSVFYDTHLFTGSISSVPTSPPPWTRTNELFEHPDCRQWSTATSLLTIIWKWKWHAAAGSSSSGEDDHEKGGG